MEMAWPLGEAHRKHEGHLKSEVLSHTWSVQNRDFQSTPRLAVDSPYTVSKVGNLTSFISSLLWLCSGIALCGQVWPFAGLLFLGSKEVNCLQVAFLEQIFSSYQLSLLCLKWGRFNLHQQKILFRFNYRFLSLMLVLIGAGHLGTCGVDQNVKVEAIFASQTHLQQQTTECIWAHTLLLRYTVFSFFL